MNEKAMVVFWCLCFRKKVHAEILQRNYWPLSCCHLLNSAFQKSERKLFLCPWQTIIGLSENSSWNSLQDVSSPIFCSITVSYVIRPSSLGL